MGITRGKYQASERVLLGLSANQETVPPLPSQPDILLWAGRMVDGEAERVLGKQEPPRDVVDVDLFAIFVEVFEDLLANDQEQIKGIVRTRSRL